MSPEQLSLEKHIAICDLRHQEVNHRLDILEQKMDRVQRTIDSFRNTIIDYAVKGAIGLVLLMAGTIFVIQI
jgi:hypothetical protein